MMVLSFALRKCLRQGVVFSPSSSLVIGYSVNRFNCLPLGICGYLFSRCSFSTNTNGDGEDLVKNDGDCVLPKPVKLGVSKYEPRVLDGTKNPILIYHGLFGSRHNWRSLSKAISERTRRLVIPMDVRNHGSSGHSDEMSYPAIVSDALEMMSNKKINEATLIGHSLGGRAFIHFALNFPEKVEKLIIVDVGMLRPGQQSHDHIQIISAMMSSIKDLPINSSRTEVRKIVDHRLKNIVIDPFIRGFLLLNLIENESGQVTWQCNLNALEASLKSGLIDTMSTQGVYNGPTLLIYGGKSEYVDDNQIVKLNQHFPNLKTHCIKDGTHYLHVEKASEFLEHTIKFIN